jgi:hypothetical protein
MDHCPESSNLIMIAIKSSVDAVACVIKYLVAASVDREFPLLISRGMNANILISRPIHVSTQWELVIVIIVPISMVNRIINLAMGLISTGRYKPTFSGYRPNSLFS